MAKIAQVGCGYWGKNLCRNFAELGLLGAVVDGDPETAAKMAATYGVPVLTFDEVLADPEIGGICLATPAPTHASLALRAIAAGKGVMIEKPLALTSDDGAAVVDAARQANVPLMVGHLLQYHPVFVALRELVRGGELGALRYVYSNRMSLGKFRIEENVLWSFAPHDISMLLALTDSPVATVAAQGAAIVTPGIADWCTVQLAFENGLRGHVQVSWLHPFKEHRLVVVGDRAMAVFDDSEPDWDRKLSLYDHGIDRTGSAPVPVKADARYVRVERGEPLRTECAHFGACVANGTTPQTDGVEALAVLRVLEQAEAQLARSLAR
ncbi:Gfo/Idh/MocA family protein [Sphingomonas sp. SUN039]|uniref:Gfo/Idh/MocA family protein n=1 Tax=Sphingomonas sp. SUN039 TaxID=2937787 RepID=UPI00216499D2|nr:Gfo/Idh/MocA family oxidoreductase [Sphingomonas sp. SUN039]UVO52849.1 Gfo/Idh/MocA family oxidoreductase [Sphingomonas sp. SUN039]